MTRKKVVLGMSGGVDSSVAAYLLKEEGYDVIGITMKIWQDDNSCEVKDNGGCCGLSAVQDARKVADKLNIPYYVLNFKKDFKNKVINYFIDEYYSGNTPNPCIACNRYIKWNCLLKKAIEIGADYISTGHYAQIIRDSITKRLTLKKSYDVNKDQTYVLYNLTQYQLEHTIFPLGSFSKDEVRKIAANIDIDISNKEESQEICFIEDNDYGKFLENNSNKSIIEGNFIDIEGKILGKHKGIIYYTIGQRKGIGLSFAKPMFVKEIRAKTNEIVLSQEEYLFSDGLIAYDINFMSVKSIKNKIKVKAKLRYSHKPCISYIILKDNNIIECKFEQPQRAVTPGQSVVFYDYNDCIICGGIIKNSL